MRRFIKTVVPQYGYKEVIKAGDVWIVHLEPVMNAQEGSVTCYECTTDSEPDISQLTADLQVWKAYVTGRELEVAKQGKIAELMAYDSSSAVNSFELRQSGQKVTDYWIDRDLRTSLEGDVKAAMEVGTTYDFDVRELGITLTLDCGKFLGALDALRRYAYTAYNQTSRHLAAVTALQTKEQVGEYDFTQGYPEKLVFNIEDLI